MSGMFSSRVRTAKALTLFFAILIEGNQPLQAVIAGLALTVSMKVTTILIGLNDTTSPVDTYPAPAAPRVLVGVRMLTPFCWTALSFRL